MYDVFISFKKTDPRGGDTEDVQIAAELCERLEAEGLKVFFSERSLVEIGSSQYTDDINRALDESRAMVVVLTRAEYAEARWVKYEWNGFHNDYLRNRRADLNLFTLVKNVDSDRLPRELRDCQSFDIWEGYEPVISALLVALGRKPPARPPKPAKEQKKTKLHPAILPVLGGVLCAVLVCALVPGLLSGQQDQGETLPQGETTGTVAPEQTGSSPTTGQTGMDFSGGSGQKDAAAIYPGLEYECAPPEGGAWENWFVFTAPDVPSVMYFQCDTLDNSSVGWKLLDQDLQQVTEQRNGSVGGVQLMPQQQYYVVTWANDWHRYRLTTRVVECDAGGSRDTALELQPGVADKTIQLAGEEDWFFFTAPKNGAPCRVSFLAERNANKLKGTTCVTVYDAKGVKLLEKEYYYQDYHDTKGVFVDFAPEAGQKLFVRVCNKGNTGDYRLTVSELSSDGGTTMEKAVFLEIGTEQGIVVDSTLADWVAFSVEEPGKYRLTVSYVEEGEIPEGSASADIAVYIDGKEVTHFALYDGKTKELEEVTEYGGLLQISLTGRKETTKGVCYLTLTRIE